MHPPHRSQIIRLTRQFQKMHSILTQLKLDLLLSTSEGTVLSSAYFDIRCDGSYPSGDDYARAAISDLLLYRVLLVDRFAVRFCPDSLCLLHDRDAYRTAIII